jgi:hypothetical protein
MSPLVLLWASVASFVAGLWLGGWTFVRAVVRRRQRHASRTVAR